MRGASVSLGALIAALAASAPAAAAPQNCPNVVAGEHAFAGPGENCTAPAGTYNPTPTSGTLPFNDPGYGFVGYGGGQLTTAGAVSITTGANQGADAVLSTGAGSLVTLTNGATLTLPTSSAGANGAEANAGGKITLGAAGVTTTVMTSGVGANGDYPVSLYATGANSGIAATNVAVTSSAPVATQVVADQGSTISFTGGSITTSGRFAVNAASLNNSVLTLSGTDLSATGAGGNVLAVGNGGQVTGVGLTIATNGAIDAPTGVPATALVNNAYPGYTASGGVMDVSQSSITVSGSSGDGAYTADGGVTRLTNDTVRVDASKYAGLESDVGGQTFVNGGSVTVSGAYASGLFAQGVGASITTGTYNGVSPVIASTGDYSSGVQAQNGGVVTLNGGSVTNSGLNGFGLYATGANALVTANDVAVSTSGNTYGQAVVAENGGVITMTGGSANTSGVLSFAVGALPGGVVNMSGTSITTTGAGSGGVAVNGAAASFNGDHLTIIVKGGYDATDNSYPNGVYNGSYNSFSGGGTLKLTNSTIVTSSDGVLGAQNRDGGAMTITGSSISTSGASGDGVVTQAGGQTTLSAVQITTTGVAAKGLAVFDAGSVLNGSGLTITTSGGVDANGNHAQALFNGNGSGGGATGGGTVLLTGSTLTTNGATAAGVATENGGSTTLNGSAVTTSGVISDAVFGSSGSITVLANDKLTTSGNAAKGIDVEGTGTTLTGTGLTIATSGTIDPTTGFHAQGVYNGSSSPASAGTTGGGTVTLTDTSVTTSGAIAYGVETANGGSTYVYGGSIATSGAGSVALGAGGAIVTVGADKAGQVTTISTSAASTNAVAANGGATMSLTGANISTSGDGAWGLSVRDQGTQVIATDVTIRTTGSLVGGTGIYAFGVYNGPGDATSGGALTLNNANVATAGYESHALLTDAGGVTTVNGGVYATTGEHAEAIIALSGGVIAVNGASLTTSGAGATGLLLGGAGGSIVANQVTITTTGGVSSAGLAANGVYAGAYNGASGGGSVTVSDSTVTTSGQSASGVISDTGGNITVSGGAVATSGVGAQGAYAVNGGSLTIGLDAAGLGASLTTSGVSAFGVGAYHGGAVSLTGASVSTTGDGAAGLLVNDAGSALTATNVTIVTKGGVDAASGNYANGVYNGPGSRTSGGTLTLTNVAVTTSGGQSTALVTDTGGASTVTGGSFTTSGLDAAAVSLLDTGKLQIAGAVLSTAGDGSPGLSINGAGGSVTASNLTISTAGGVSAATGSHADGVFNGSFGNRVGGGTMAVADSSVTTSGLQAYGVSVSTGGITSFVGGSVATSGAGAAALRVRAGGALTVGLDAGGVGTTVSTSGLDAPGAVAFNGGALTLTGTSISVIGDGSAGLAVNDAGSTLTATNVTVVTTGGVDASDGFNAIGAYNGASSGGTSGGTMNLTNVSVTTSGDNAFGALTSTGGTTTITGGSLTTSGGNAAAALVLDAGVLNISSAALATTGAGAPGLAVNGAGGSVTGVNLTISTTGGVLASNGSHADGVYSGSFGSYSGGGTVSITDSTVKTSGAGAFGVEAGAGGTIAFLGGAIATQGAGANAARADAGGSLTIGADSTNAGTAISTAGTGSYAAVAEGGGFVSLTGATISTTGDGSGGLGVNGAGSELDATGVTIATTGAMDPTSGLHAYGASNSPNTYATGGTLKLADVAITTSGAGMFGVYTGASSTTTYAGGSVTTSGAGANGLFTIGSGASLTASGVTVNTTGAGAYAALAENGGRVALSGSTIATTGDGSGGLGVNGGGSEIDASKVSITTAGGVDSASGQHAYGASNAPGSYAAGGTLKLTDVSIMTAGASMFGVYTGASATTTYTGGAVTTSGVGAIGLYTSGSGASLTASGLTVTTSGAGAYGALAGGGGVLTLGDGVQIATTGASAHGLYVSDATANLTAATTISVTGAGAAGVYVDAGGAVAGNGALTVSAATYGLYLNGATSGTTPTTLALGGALLLKTTDPIGAALTLNGNNTSFTGAGGGVIQAAGTALALTNGVGQSASFTNYQIDSAAGDAIYADPSTSTITFDNTTVNAAGNLAHVADDSQLTLNALASSLTGGFVTDAGSTSTMTLSGGSTWMVTGNSNVTNLTLNNSAVAFAANTGGFTTLTVNNYVGNNAAITLNAALGGLNPGADQLVINGGKASGTTTLNVRAVGTGGGAGVPLVVATNGGSIAPGAFSLGGPVTVGGYTYSLQSQSGGDYLVSSQTLTPTQANSSLASLAQSRQSQMVTSHVLGSILTGATEQINCSSCSSGFASFGSFALGVHGRWTLSPSLALLAGISYDTYSARGVTVNNSLLGALGVRYDMVQLGKYRPFFETGVSVQPYANISYRRSYASNSGGGVGNGDTLSRAVAVYGRAGYIWRLSRTDEAAVYGDLTRSWESEGGYTEGGGGTSGNPFGALVAPSLDTLNVARIGGQFTHLFGEHIEANVSAGYAFAFDANSTGVAEIAGFGEAVGAAPSSFSWAELGGRLSYRFSRSVVADAFVLGTLGAEPAGNQIHGGVALRMAF